MSSFSQDHTTSLEKLSPSKLNDINTDSETLQRSIYQRYDDWFWLGNQNLFRNQARMQMIFGDEIESNQANLQPKPILKYVRLTLLILLLAQFGVRLYISIIDGSNILEILLYLTWYGFLNTFIAFALGTFISFSKEY